MDYTLLALNQLLTAVAEYLASGPADSPELEALRAAYLDVSSSSTMTGSDESARMKE